MPYKTVKSKSLKFYLTLVGLAALIVMVLTIISFIRQKEAMASISACGDIQSEAKRLANEIERKSMQLAEKCLKEESLLSIAERTTKDVSGNALFGLKAREILKNHPIADGLFLLVNRELYFPQLEAGKAYLPISAIGKDATPEERDFAALYRKAAGESKNRRYESAINLLEKCSAMPVPDALKSRSLDLLARVYLAARKPTDAVRIWNRLEDKFPDCLNEYHVPYALVAAIEIDELDAGRNTDRRESIRNLYADLLNGRWLLSEEVVLKLKERLEKRLGHATPAIADSSFMRQFRLARIIGKELEMPASAQPNVVYEQSVLSQDGGIQIYYIILKKNGPERILAMAADTQWISGPLLNQSRRELKSPIITVSDFHIQPVHSAVESAVKVPFENAFRFLELHLPAEAVSAALFDYKVNLEAIGLMALLMLILLVIIAFMIARISREQMVARVRSNFVGHVSHELKTPLTMIKLYVETLLTDESLSEEDRRYSLEVISRESENLLNLIENLLQLSRTENAREQYKMSLGDLGALVEKTAGLCTEWLDKQGIRLNVGIAPALPRVLFDSEKITRAFLNLIDNARKYGGDSESIEVRAWSEDGRVMVSVQDHGAGIPESERKAIFNQFYRGGNSGDKRGVGLGLYLVNETMKAHKGSIELESEVGKGSIFKLVFPAETAKTLPGRFQRIPKDSFSA